MPTPQDASFTGQAVTLDARPIPNAGADKRDAGPTSLRLRNESIVSSSERVRVWRFVVTQQRRKRREMVASVVLVSIIAALVRARSTRRASEGRSVSRKGDGSRGHAINVRLERHSVELWLISALVTRLPIQ